MLRAIVVVASALLVIGLTLPNIAPPSPVGNGLSLSVNYHFDVVSITPGSMAERAGLRVGDHIEPRSLDAIGRLALNAQYLLRAGESVRFVVDRQGRQVEIEMGSQVGDHQFSGLALVKRLTATIFIVVAATLLLLRPSTMLWGFYLYALGSTGGGSILMEFVSPHAATITSIFLFGILYPIGGPLGLLIFATHFPTAADSGWRAFVARLIPGFAALLAIPSAAQMLFIAGVPLPAVTDLLANAVFIGVTAIGLSALLAGFVRLDASGRQRLRWVVAGFAVYFAAVTYQTLASYLPGQGWPAAWSNAGWTADVLNGFVVVIPVIVAYAVLKHHVLDLNFVIGRGLVYGILTSVAVATFAVVDWFLGTVLAQTKLAVAGEIVAAIAIGFWLNGLHGSVDRFVDAVIFSRRHLAQKRLERVAAGLPHAQTAASVAEMLIAEPVSALGLLCGAVLRRTPDGGFQNEFAIGPPSLATARLEPGDPLGVHLHGERGPVFLHHVDWNMPGATAGESQPVIAIPIFVRFTLQGIAVYGGHAMGEAIDPDEVRLLQSLATGAAAALDHLEAEELRQQLEEAHKTIAMLMPATS